MEKTRHRIASSNEPKIGAIHHGRVIFNFRPSGSLLALADGVLLYVILQQSHGRQQTLRVLYGCTIAMNNSKSGVRQVCEYFFFS